MIFDTEKNMENDLDDMLVNAGLEEQRQTIHRIIISDNRKKTSLVKSPARVKVKISSFQYDTVAHFVSISYKNEVCNFDLETLQPTQDCVDNGIPKSIKKIMKHIRATFKQHKQELASIAYDAKRTPLIFKHFRVDKNKLTY